ncbi:uncharacterized protein LOC131685065 [Topomyia yanbarensis]|uniref:uncharacterized protein LOC131685065 n=1 Tax=Topomyia yanbarensis TaxID=2498891 RepID=UPI00273B23D7|nr:uncharacterized protein LOC131685065 [Topomyia yanbarensis]XP_058824468.1 uncharacterized protein LOC131685065 [Topomyia yanbarensis]
MDNELHNRAFVEDYFANLNDLSKKITLDIGEIKATYEHIWDDLSREEQMEIINETLIKPELTLKYFDNFSTSSDSFQNIIDDENSDDRKVNLYDGKALQTFQYLKTGRKVIHDDSIGLFRDEHSAPFSHKTKSQINLTLFPPEKEKPTERRFDLAKKLEKVKSPKPPASSEARHSTKTIIDDNVSYDKNILIEGNKCNDATNNFLASFICSQAGGPVLASVSIGSDEIDGQSLENIGFDDDKINLFRNSSRSDSLHQAPSSSVEDDDKNFDELNSLLGTSKGFDFLNNW